jgi:predicted membrane protein
MNTKDYLKKICFHTCLYFTAATLLLLLVSIIVNNDLTRGIHPGNQALLFPFALLFALANILFQYGAFKTWIRVVLHYALTILSVFCCLYLPNREANASASQGFKFFLAITIIYAIIMGVLLGVRARIKRVTRDAAHYKSVYKQDKDENKNTKNSQKNKKDKDDYQSVFKKK